MATKAEIRKLYNLSSDEKKQVEQIFQSVNPSRRIEYVDKLVEAGFNGRKIRAAAREKDLRFPKKANARPDHINKIAEAIFIAEDFHSLSYFAACILNVLYMCGYTAKSSWIEKQVSHFQERVNNDEDC